MIDLKETFELYEDEYMKFELVQVRMSKRPDIHAFMLLDDLTPGGGDMVAAAEHDEIWLASDCEELAKIITKDQVRQLCRCGVMFDSETDSLHMYV